MKKLVVSVLLIVLLSVGLFAETNIYQKVLSTNDSVSAAMTKTRIWIARAFDYNTLPVAGMGTVPVFLDIDNPGGVISLGGTITISSMPGNGPFFNEYWNALMLFEFKEGKIRMSIPKIFGTGAPSSIAFEYLDASYDKAIKKIQPFLDSYEKFLTSYSSDF